MNKSLITLVLLFGCVAIAQATESEEAPEVRVEPETVEVPLFNPNKPDVSLYDQDMEQVQPLRGPRFMKGGKSIPTVTKVLYSTLPETSRVRLDRWKEEMVEKLGRDGFSQYQEDSFSRGRIIHSLLAKFLSGGGDPTEEIRTAVVANLWKSLQSVIIDITNVRLVDRAVVHADLMYRGLVDCVAAYKGEMVVIDFKTAEKPKTDDTLHECLLQLAANCGAVNNDVTIPNTVIDRNIGAGLLIVAYTDGSQATVHHLGRDQIQNQYWNQWIERLGQATKTTE